MASTRDPSDDNWRCENCDIPFSDLESRLIHNLEVHKTSGILQCNNCCYKSFSMCDIQQHISKKNHPLDTNFTDAVSDKEWSCDKCALKVSFNNLDSWIRHNLKVHEKSGIIQCKVNCGYMCDKMLCVRDHMIFEHPTETYYCLICEKYNFTSSDWKEHKLNEHNDRVTQLPKCIICSGNFRNFQELENHHKKNHCTTCNVCKKLIIKGVLDEHMDDHLSDYPYQCLRCETRYKTQTALVEHLSCSHVL